MLAEHPVGGFSLDLIGRDESTGQVVIVENQLEVSDHTHLGQILTYAAGTEPTTIVWVAAGFRPEHRAALQVATEGPETAGGAGQHQPADHVRMIGSELSGDASSGGGHLDIDRDAETRSDRVGVLARQLAQVEVRGGLGGG